MVVFGCSAVVWAGVAFGCGVGLWWGVWDVVVGVLVGGRTVDVGGVTVVGGGVVVVVLGVEIGAVDIGEVGDVTKQRKKIWSAIDR